MSAREQKQRRRRFDSGSAAETEAVGARIAAGLGPGDVVVVSGELGAGKTTLIRGACRALGVEGPVTSPTFTIGQRYDGRLPVSHLDLYRLGGLEDEDPALLDDYLDPATVGFVEWPTIATPALAGRPLLPVSIEHLDRDRRRIEWSAATPRK